MSIDCNIEHVGDFGIAADVTDNSRLSCNFFLSRRRVVRLRAVGRLRARRLAHRSLALGRMSAGRKPLHRADATQFPTRRIARGRP
jgi:hypothetical protein